MDIYKTFLYEVRKLCFVDPVLLINGDETPILRKFIKHFQNVKFEDGEYHTYFGDIKRMVSSFVTCWAKTMDETYILVDKHTHVVSRDILLELMEATISLNQTKQIEFGREFLPVQSKLEEEVYKEVEEGFDNFMVRLHQLRSDIERLDKREKVDDFAENHFPISLKKKNEVFVYTHKYMCLLLTDQVVLYRMRVSIEEILLRVGNNLKVLQDQCTSSLNSLLNQLYDKNKEHLNIYRQDTRSSLEIAEVQRSMEILKDKIEDSKYISISRLLEERKYWEERLDEFMQITEAITRLNVQMEIILEQESIFHRIRCPFNDKAPKGECWLETEKTLKENLQSVRDLQDNAAKALMSFLSVRGIGSNRIFYSDNIGPYYLDEYGHQVYFFDYGLKLYHVDCDGKLIPVDETEKHYYDEMGRFVLDADGNKLYKVSACESSFELKDDVFKKHSVDCGHSEREMHGCRNKLRDPNDVTFMPIVEDVDLTEHLEPETSEYLWSSFGHILPLALRDVATAQPRNPIHYLAHKLLYHKHSRTKGELKAMKKEAEKYRAKIFQDRIDKATAESKAWKAKQVKRRKPEESDDAADWAALGAYRAGLQLIRDLNYFYD